MSAPSKTTDAGILPADWECRPLGELVAPGTSVTYGIVQAGPEVSDGIPYIRTGDMSGEALPIDGLAKTHPSIAARFPRSRVNAGELVYSIRASVGAVHLVPDELDGANLTQGTARIAPSPTTHPIYLLNALRSSACQSWISLRTKGTTYKEITLATLRELAVPVPPLSEQKAIAAVLSDVDALLGALDRLIAKKRDLKQAAMQQLLTGQTRLPGFTGKWETKRLGQLFDITSSKRVFQSEWRSEGVPFYRARELAVLGDTGRVDNELFIAEGQYEAFKAAHGVPAVGDMLVTGVGTLGKVYVVSDDRKFYFKDGNIIWFRIGGRMSAEFLRQLYRTELITKQISDGSAGTTVGTYTISGAKKTEIPVPPLPEQHAIAVVLADMDAELSAIEERRDKTRLLKQGMMQELLTGRTRLV